MCHIDEQAFMLVLSKRYDEQLKNGGN
jgi:hypothetical protein